MDDNLADGGGRRINSETSDMEIPQALEESLSIAPEPAWAPWLVYELENVEAGKENHCVCIVTWIVDCTGWHTVRGSLWCRFVQCGSRVISEIYER